MSFDLARFHAVIGQVSGPQSPALFRARVYGPQILSTPLARDSAPLIEFLCQAASLPGVGFAAAPVTDIGFGPPRDVPLAPAYSPVDLQVMVDEAGHAHSFFKNWSNRVLKWDHKPGTTRRDEGRHSFQSSYPIDYAGTVVISTFGKDGQLSEEVELHQAYPRWVGDTRLGWGETDAYATFNVQLAYWTWTSLSTEATEDL
jgi:hypothetical protein